LVTDVSILFGIMGLYGFQHQESRLWGFFGFVLATIGIGLIIGPDGERDRPNGELFEKKKPAIDLKEGNSW
jgi:hypothetical protein